MGRFLFALLLLAAAAPAFADSFLFVSHGQSITNGEPVNIKALKARHIGSYFWFSIDGKSYIVRDPKVLSRMKVIYQPLFSTGAGANDYAARVDAVNRDIEHQLHDLGTQLIAQRTAVRD